MEGGINPNTIATIATIAIAFAALIFTVINTNRSAKKDYRDEINREDTRFDSLKESMVKVNVKLDTLCGTANETRQDVKSTNKDLANIQNHIAMIDERITSLDKRIHNLEVNVFDKVSE